MEKKELYSAIDLNQIDNAIAIINPVSSNIKKGLKRLRHFEKNTSLRITEQETSRFEKITTGIIRGALESSNLIILIGGDGVFNKVVRTITNNGLSDQAKKVPILSLGGGGADDGVKANHSKYYRKNPEKILEDGRIVETHPIRFEVRDMGADDSEPTFYSAAFYASLGMTGLISSDRYLNNPRHRNYMGRFRFTRAISEPTLAVRSYWASRLNTVIQAGEERQFFDEVFANSGIMAKYLHFPTHLTEAELFHTIAPSKKLFQFLGAAAASMKGSSDGDYLRLGEKYEFTTMHDVHAQFDGEGEIIPSNSHVTVSQYEQPFYVVISNLEL